MKPLMARRTYREGISKLVARDRLRRPIGWSHMLPLRLTYHRILPHQHNARNITPSSQTLSDLVHLLRADIVDCNDEDGLVLFKQGLELVKVDGLVAGSAPHVFLLLKIGFLRVRGLCL